MKPKYWIFIGFAIILFCFSPISTVFSANYLQPKSVIFRSTDEKLEMAKEVKADLLVPDTFKKGMKYYREAEEMYQNKEDMDEMKQFIDRSKDLFEKAIKDSQIAGVLFTETMVAREDTLKINGDQLDPVNWNEAEFLFRDAAEELEDGDSDNAKSIGKEAEILYRKAELKAIQSKYLKEVWSLLNKAENMDIRKYAPITLEKAKNFAKKAESLLHLHRYDQKDAEQLSNQAEYEVKHAIYMAGIIKPLEDNDRTFESIFLDAEIPIKNIANSLSLSVKFDEGFDIPTQNIINSIHLLQKENIELSKILQNDKSELSNIIKMKNNEIKELNDKIGYLENRLNKLASSEEKLKFEIEQEKIRKEKIHRISASFSSDEGKALLDGKNVLIRLYGLNFPSGKSDIKPQFFGLLSKLKNAFSEFPGCFITIEGHTDAIGGDSVNQQLSEDRAEAVRQYIIANSNISWDRIQAKGYGETHPVASNETPEGQAKNRRIDVVIQPISQ
ncbi:MAG: hypothetical protein C4522_19135 [Desulfobacteraceae bacterium]|nr:MAG: hypothetical protein C4522_19135 [Desulfobacteraceae bacterium]